MLPKKVLQLLRAEEISLRAEEISLGSKEISLRAEESRDIFESRGDIFERDLTLKRKVEPLRGERVEKRAAPLLFHGLARRSENGVPRLARLARLAPLDRVVVHGLCCFPLKCTTRT